MLSAFRRLEVRQGPLLKSRPWRDAPYAVALLKRSDPRRDCLEAEGRSSNLKAWRAAPQACQVLTPCPMLYALCRSLEVLMPAIASLEDLKAAQKDLLEAKDLEELKRVFKKWRKIGWKNVCKLWLEERTPEQLKGEGDH